MKKKIKVSRLRKLAKHLRGTHLAHKKFNFLDYARGKINKSGNYCGSSGCAIGEFPAVWPNEWRWEPELTGYFIRVVHKSQKIKNISWYVIADFFSITERQAKHLFFPDAQNIEKFGGRELGNGATAKNVANNIDAFIEKVAS